MFILEKGAKIVLFEKQGKKKRHRISGRKLLTERLCVEDILDRSELIPDDAPAAGIFMKKEQDLLTVFF